MKYLFWLLLLLAGNCWAIKDTLYINRSIEPLTSYNVHLCSFNTSNVFENKNVVKDYTVNEVVDFTIYNTDSVDHVLWLTDGTSVGVVQANSLLNFTHNFNQFGTFSLKLTDFIGQSLGAAAVIKVGLENEQSFTWNLWDVNAQLSANIGTGNVNTIPFDYKPNLCTINRTSYPNTMSDPEGAVTGYVGDTIYISIVNGGNMVHTLHFHGYHVKVVQVSKRQKMLDWTKDTLPIMLNESLTLRLVPDKEGMYPVHDHNLINVLSNGNTYPGGMITRLNIQL